MFRFRFLTDLKSGLLPVCCLLLGLANTAHAVPITLDANGTSFNAELLTGSSNVGVIFYHGRGSTPTGNVVNQLRNSLNSNGYTTLSLSDPIPTTGTAFSAYENEEASINDQVFARLDAALAELASQGIQHVVLSGFSIGSRFMTAAAAAWQQGIYNPGVNIDLLGLVGVGMHSAFATSTPTAANPTSLSDFNVLDTMSNLAFLDSLPTLDVYGDQDTQSAALAGARANAYGGNPSLYTQAQLECPPNNGTYYAKSKTSSTGWELYYGADGSNTNNCHRLLDGWTLDASGNYVDSFHVRTNSSAPLQTAVNDFFARYIVPQVSAPEPGTLLLMLVGLPLLLLTRKRRGL